jgi:hypothetical protein
LGLVKKKEFDVQACLDQLTKMRREFPGMMDGQSLLPGCQTGFLREDAGPFWAYVYLGRLQCLDIQGVSLDDASIVDEFTFCFAYRGYRFALRTALAYDLFLDAASDVPKETFELVLEHLRRTPRRSLWLYLVGGLRFMFLPPSPHSSWLSPPSPPTSAEFIAAKKKLDNLLK